MTPDVKALQATIEEGWAKAEQYSRTCTGEMGYARVHEDITAGREAYAALLQHVARLEDENRRLYSCVKFVASRHPDGNPKFAIEAAQELLASLAPTAAAPGGEEIAKTLPPKTADYLMNCPMSEWPETLHKTMHNVSERIGISGDVIYETIKAWQKGGERLLTYDEVIGLEGN